MTFLCWTPKRSQWASERVTLQWPQWPQPRITVMMANLAEETQQAQGPQKAKEAVHQAIRSAHYTEQISQSPRLYPAFPLFGFRYWLMLSKSHTILTIKLRLLMLAQATNFFGITIKCGKCPPMQGPCTLWTCKSNRKTIIFGPFLAIDSWTRTP